MTYVVPAVQWLTVPVQEPTVLVTRLWRRLGPDLTVAGVMAIFVPFYFATVVGIVRKRFTHTGSILGEQYYSSHTGSGEM